MNPAHDSALNAAKSQHNAARAAHAAIAVEALSEHDDFDADETDEGLDGSESVASGINLCATSSIPTTLQENREAVLAAMVPTDDGRRVRVPAADSYPGEAPYGAPLTGFHGKVEGIFDAFAYFPVGQDSNDRPRGFLPVVGMEGDDPKKNGNPAWKLHARIRPEAFEQVKQEVGDIGLQPVKAVILVTGMRADHIALVSISQPHQIFAPSLWLAALPITAMKHQAPTLDEPKVRAIVLAERARAEVDRTQAAQAKAKRGEQMALGF